jgi:uncharacterized lipoprotein YmbA
MVVLLCMAGCGRSPQVTYYALTAPVLSEVSVLIQPAAPSVAIMAVSLPELVDRPQLVLHDTGSKVLILEAHRWAEPLKQAIAQLLAENLSRTLGSDQVSAYPQHAALQADYRVFVDIRRFEATATSVTVDALWSIRGMQGGGPLTGRSKFTEPFGGAGYEAMVIACSRAVTALSKEIAQAIPSAQTKE